MKTLFLMMAMTSLSAISFAQKNNPYNQRGIDFVSSVNLITNDFNSGKVKDFTEESLNKYSKLIPLQNQVSLDLSASIVKTLKAPGYSFMNFINSSSLSAYSKTMFTQLFNFNNQSGDDFRKVLTDKVTEINTAKIDPTEKELLLSVAAMSYNTDASTFAGRGVSCEVVGPNGSTTVSHSSCVLICAGIGAVIGIRICGIWCGLGGAVIGAIVGAVC